MGKTNLPKTNRKGGPLGNTKRNNIKKEIIQLIDTGNYSKIHNNKLAFARDKKINRATLNKLLDEIIPDLDNVSSEIIKVDIMGLYQRMKTRILYWWDKCENAPEDEQSFLLEKQVFREMREVLRDFRQTCIDLGVIDPIVNKVELQGVIINASVDIQSESTKILEELNG